VRTLVIICAVFLFVWLVALGALVLAGRGTEAKQLVRLIPDLGALVRGLLGDDRVPRGSKVLLWVALAWVVSPIDLVPEFLPVIGPLDDVVVVALVLRHLAKSAGPDVVREHWRGDPAAMNRVLRALRVGEN
jgi:uncharacterized membrane protein YkvA (DUF1232 family)